MLDDMPTNLRWSEREMWAKEHPSQYEVRLLLGRISRLRAGLDPVVVRSGPAVNIATGVIDERN
jgi:hypothetical protein